MKNWMAECRLYLLLAALTLVSGAKLCLAQQKTVNHPTVHELFLEDQKDREEANPDWNKVSADDRRHREIVQKMLQAGELKTGQDYEDAAFIFQHGDKPQDYLLAHILAVDAIEKGRAAARWIAAATLDRYLQSVKEPQVFGTQYLLSGSAATQEPYDTTLLSDALRQEFCVTSYAGQQQNLSAMKQDKEWPSPDHCPKSQPKEK